jgi:hypothetical protein
MALGALALTSIEVGEGEPQRRAPAALLLSSGGVKRGNLYAEQGKIGDERKSGVFLPVSNSRQKEVSGKLLESRR